MNLELRLDAQRPRAWMARLVKRREDRQDTVRLTWLETSASKPVGLEPLFELERLILRKGRRGDADAIGRNELRVSTQVQPAADTVIDFTGEPRETNDAAKRYLRPLFNGAPGEDAALAAILAGDLPVLEIRDEVSGAIVAAGDPSAELAGGLAGALDSVMARTITLLDAALAETPHSPSHLTGRVTNGARSPAGYVLRGLVSDIARRIYRLCCYAPHWHVGWRYTDDQGIWSSKDLSGPAFKVLADPGHTFYADPFPMTWQGRTFVFFEELDHRIGKGTISAVEFGEAGPKGPVLPVLEEPWHLSYPFLIEQDGELWMIPESSGNRDVTLYRCVSFPDKWERHATLLSDIELGDATIVRHEGRFYLFGATRDGGGGYSDTLSIFHATDLFGPWLPHANNPIMVDRASARPAGNFVHIDGGLWRPVQDCSQGYGAALGLAEVHDLTPETFSQTVRHTLRPGERWPGRKLHTLNRCGRLEVIDGSRIEPKIRALGRFIN